MKKVSIRAVIIFTLFVSTAVWTFSGCSIKKLAMKNVADMMAGEMGAAAFSSDGDIELVGDALPFALKLYEIILEENPEHPGMLETAGMAFVSYARVYVQMPADMLPADRYVEAKEMRSRAKRLYLRGRDYLFRALEARHPGFTRAVLGMEEAKSLETFLAEMTGEDISALYWAAAGWFAAYSADTFDMELALQMPKALAMMDRTLELDPDWGNGLVHEFYISYYGSLPEGMVEGSEEKAREHFSRAVVLSDGKNPSPYVSLATTLCIQRQYAKEFVILCKTALALDPDADPGNRLQAEVARRKASWHLEHMEDFFLVSPEELGISD
jgi:predicted anti-sigma-YlaC factor YlaD